MLKEQLKREINKSKAQMSNEIQNPKSKIWTLRSLDIDLTLGLRLGEPLARRDFVIWIYLDQLE